MIVRTIMIVIEVLCSLMLIGLVLLQKSKGGGLGSAFGGGGDGSMFGSRTGNVLTKATIILGVTFLLNTLVLGMMFARNESGPSDVDKELMRGVVTEVSEAPAGQTDGIGVIPVVAPDEETMTPVDTDVSEEPGIVVPPLEDAGEPVESDDEPTA